jgi:hypothetical protein
MNPTTKQRRGKTMSKYTMKIVGNDEGADQARIIIEVNGFELDTLLAPLITSGVFGGDDGGYLYYISHQITYPTLTFSDPNYGDPLLLMVSDIHLDGLTALSGSVVCTANCNNAVSPVPLPPALPLFATAVLALVGFGAYQSRRAARG